MSYSNWITSHGEKHNKIIEKLNYLSNEEVINYFEYNNMIKNEPDFCPLYAKKEKCHNISSLNCYLCACPYFRYTNEGIQNKDTIIYSTCSIQSKHGTIFKYKNEIHQDCSNCIIPHNKKFIKQNFSRNWFDIMPNSIE